MAAWIGCVVGEAQKDGELAMISFKVARRAVQALHSGCSLIDVLVKRFIRTVISKKALADRQAKGNDPNGTTCDGEGISHGDGLRVPRWGRSGNESGELGKSYRARAENIRPPDDEAETTRSQERKEAQQPGQVALL
jgi:hypothetical protein